MNHENYLIKTISNNDSQKLEIWSTKRLMFEPKNWMKDMRNDVRDSLKRLKPVKNGILYCKFSTGEKLAFFDVENVLLYNVGSGAFLHLGDSHLLIERSFENIPSIEHSETFRHYHLYNHTKKENIHPYWKKGDSVVRLCTIQMPSLKDKPHEYWYHMKKNTIVTTQKPLAEGANFGIKLNLGVPFGKKVNLTGICKPLIDGFVSAFHSYNGGDLNEVGNRLAGLLVKQKSEIIDLLIDEQQAVFGKREVIRRFQKGIQWNPSDDFCNQIEIETFWANGTNWVIEGEMYTFKENNNVPNGEYVKFK